MKTAQSVLVLAMFSSFTLGACDGSDSGDVGNSGEGTVSDTMEAAVETYAKIVSASYTDALEAGQDLNSAVKSFVDDPSKSSLKEAREAWLVSREPYLQTEVYRFYEGPIDNEEDGPEGMMNAWPLDEAYIDYVKGGEGSGIINDKGVEISADALMALNEAGGETNIATGYHAIEFLLWGQDHDKEGPGARPHTDYLSGDAATAENADRRGKYLGVVTDLLIEHLGGLDDAWKAGKSNYRAEFEEDDAEATVAKILTGMIILSGFETGGERLQAALTTGDQEDEHSCFSDNTHRDMIQDVQGVLNVYLGSYQAMDGPEVEGTGIRQVVETFDRDLADELEDKIRESLALANDLEMPFDQAIDLDNDEGREGVAKLVTALREQEALLEDVFRGLELEIPEAE